LPLLVRSWNVFHGNADRPERSGFLEEMIRLAVADRPDVLCLQEVPAWAVERLDDWSGMIAAADVAAPPSLGPVPLSAELGGRLTRFHNGLFRSLFAGQANAILLRPGLELVDRQAIVLNARSFRSLRARELGLDLVTRLAWAKERRLCQAVRVRLEDAREAIVANLHATSSRDHRVPDAEVLRAATFADGLARPGETVVLAGDFNVRPEQSETLRELTGPEWGFSKAGPGIDHVLVRDGTVSPVEVWPEERRRVDGRLLSDHAPVEAVVS
jgi:endonuclease/exonuclease/phosphatase family metal-dependent hydrolase